MTDPDLIIFDCDGVLVDSEVLSCRCLSEVLAGHGISLGLDQALDLFLGRSMTAVLDHYKTLERLNPEQFSAELRQGVHAAFPRRAISSEYPSPFPCPALRRISTAGCILRKWWNAASPRPISSFMRP